MKPSVLIVLLYAALSFTACQISTSHSNTTAESKTNRAQILQGMEMAMGKLPDRANLPPLDIHTIDSLKTDTYTRLTITFTAAENETVPAYLYVPHQSGQKKKLAAMLVLHGTGALGKKLVDGESPKYNRALAKELAERGYVVIAPDYPSMGDLKDYDFQNDRYQSGTMKAIFNHMRCVDLLQAREDVDPERIGVIGHSLGGHNAMFVAAFDTRLKVVVASCGWTLMDYYNIGEEASKRYGGRLGPWAQDRYMPLLREKYNLEADKIPFDFDGVIAAIAPRPFFSNSPINDSNFNVEGVRKGIEEAKEIYQLLRADSNLQVRYPKAGHDFPAEVRLESYQFIDKHLNHTPNDHELEKPAQGKQDFNLTVAAEGLIPEKDKPHIVFLISEDPLNYEAHKTIPEFAGLLRRNHNFKVSVLKGEGKLNEFHFPNLGILSEADLVVVFFRRIALRSEQLDIIKKHLEEGKPLVGIRTANHAFSVRNATIPDGYEDWWDFVPDVLGCENKGYGPTEPGTDVALVLEKLNHPILKGIEPKEWHSKGNVYLVAPLLDEYAEILITGTAEENKEPVAWTRHAGKSRIFYTSLGYPDDFQMPQFQKLLVNGIYWTLDQNVN